MARLGSACGEPTFVVEASVGQADGPMPPTSLRPQDGQMDARRNRWEWAEVGILRVHGGRMNDKSASPTRVCSLVRPTVVPGSPDWTRTRSTMSWAESFGRVPLVTG